MSNQNLIGHPICTVCLWPVPAPVSFSEWDSRLPTHCPTCDPVKPPAPAPEDTELEKRAEEYGVFVAQPIMRSMYSCSRGELTALLAFAFKTGALSERELVAHNFTVLRELTELATTDRKWHRAESRRLRDALTDAHYDLERIATADWGVEQIRMAAEAGASNAIRALREWKSE